MSCIFFDFLNVESILSTKTNDKRMDHIALNEKACVFVIVNNVLD